MKSVVKMLAAVGLCAAAAIPALADPGTKVALVPGGPHPYFAAWEQAGMDAMKDLGLGAADYRVPLPGCDPSGVVAPGMVPSGGVPAGVAGGWPSGAAPGSLTMTCSTTRFPSA